MSVAAPPRLPEALTRFLNTTGRQGGECFTIGDIDWETYRQISDELTGRHLRITYEDGRLDLMTISGKHGNLCRLFVALIRVLAEELSLPLRCYGDMTCDKKKALRGLEPDECFYIQNEPAVRLKDDIDLTVDPPPDLAVEIELSRARRDRLSVYAGVGVPEVWRYNGKRLTGHVLSKDGKSYVESNVSRAFPKLQLVDLQRFVELRTQLDETSLIRSFREWARELAKSL